MLSVSRSVLGKLRPTKEQLFAKDPIRKAPVKFKGSGTLERSIKVTPTKTGVKLTSNWRYAGKVDRSIGITKTGLSAAKVITKWAKQR